MSEYSDTNDRLIKLIVDATTEALLCPSDELTISLLRMAYLNEVQQPRFNQDRYKNH